jgi:hypothetical protein
LACASETIWITVRFAALSNETTYYLSDVDAPIGETINANKTIDLDIDIGADAVDYKCVATCFFFFSHSMTNNI